MNTDKFFQTKLFKGIVLGIAGLIVLAFVFGLGIFVGTEKAEFSFKWADDYHKNFAGPQAGFLGNMMGQDLTNGNGVFGQIIKINGETLVIKGRDNVEKNVLVSDKTTIVFQRKNIKLSDLKINESVVVIGDPDNNGQIQAELIRAMPSPSVPSVAPSAPLNAPNSATDNPSSPSVTPQS